MCATIVYTAVEARTFSINTQQAVEIMHANTFVNRRCYIRLACLSLGAANHAVVLLTVYVQYNQIIAQC